MKMLKWKNHIAALLIVIMLALTGCSESAIPENSPDSTAQPSYTLKSIPAYEGTPYAVINENIPEFTPNDSSEPGYESYGELDSLGRCTGAYAYVGRETMPTEERGSIGQVKPTGWHTVKYDCVDGKYLYNRCHLIGYQLTAENANECNLITGTRYMNVEGMLPFENMVADYIKETENHVCFRVTPVFEGDNLVASGVIMEAQSAEDDGEGVQFNVYVYNVQPGVEIDYATGESRLASASDTQESDSAIEIRGNKNSKIYHMPGDQAYEQMADSKNLVIFHSEQEAQDAGYRRAKQ